MTAVIVNVHQEITRDTGMINHLEIVKNGVDFLLFLVNRMQKKGDDLYTASMLYDFESHHAIRYNSERVEEMQQTHIYLYPYVSINMHV